MAQYCTIIYVDNRRNLDMTKKCKRRVLHVFLLEAAILVVVIGVIAIVYSFRYPLQVSYHKNRERAALNAMRESWEPNGPHDSYERHQTRLQHHKKALLKLG